MPRKNSDTVTCQVCGKQKKPSEAVPVELVRTNITEAVKKSRDNWDPGGYICIDDLNAFRAVYIRDVIAVDKGELTTLEEQVLDSLKEHELLTSNVNVEFEHQLTFGEKLSDKIAGFGGSWSFIILAMATLIGWIALNSAALLAEPFDPYPYILLNLVLSCLAAMQAPIIMMSQNRQEDKDRLRAEHDYRIDLKAELEIRHLHEKIDHLLMKQWQRLLEIQEIQTEIMEELAERKRRPS